MLTENTQIENFSYRELQAECKKHDLSAGGKKDDLLQRLQAKMEDLKLLEQAKTIITENTPPRKNNARRQSVLAETMLCQLTETLPFDPVMATDDQLYERTAIQEVIDETNGRKVISPITLESIQATLTPCPQIKKAIEKAVDSGEITGELADDWKKKRENHQQIQDWMKMAKGGDADAAVNVGKALFFGKMGLQKDKNAAVEWWRIASDKGHALGMYEYAVHLIGRNGKADCVQAVALLGEAAAKGVAVACFVLGGAYTGKYSLDLPKDDQHAIRLLQNGLALHGTDGLGVSASASVVEEFKELLADLKSKAATGTE